VRLGLQGNQMVGWLLYHFRPSRAKSGRGDQRYERQERVVVGIVGLFLLALSAGCKKKVPVAIVPPPAPPRPSAEVAPLPKAPTIAEFTVEEGKSFGQRA